MMQVVLRAEENHIPTEFDDGNHTPQPTDITRGYHEGTSKHIDTDGGTDESGHMRPGRAPHDKPPSTEVYHAP